MEPPHSPPPPLRNEKKIFAFLDVLDNLEAKKNTKKVGKLPSSEQGIVQCGAGWLVEGVPAD